MGESLSLRLSPLVGELGLLTSIGTGLTIPNRDFEIPYTDQWMAGVDLQLPYRLDVAYVGKYSCPSLEILLRMFWI